MKSNRRGFLGVIGAIVAGKKLPVEAVEPKVREIVSRNLNGKKIYSYSSLSNFAGTWCTYSTMPAISMLRGMERRGGNQD